MFPLFESIKVVNGQLINLEWHQKRVDHSRNTLFGAATPFYLKEVLTVPDQYGHGVVKCRMSYGLTPGPVEFTNYHKKPVRTLQQVECMPFDYSLKFEDRSKLDKLFKSRGVCDDVLITHNGYLTDTSYSNVVLYDGACWITPDTPLLQGTQRAKLLNQGAIKTGKIHISDLGGFEKLVLINAMIAFDPMDFVLIDDIVLWTGKR